MKTAKKLLICAALAFALQGAVCADLDQGVLSSVSAFLNDGNYMLYRSGSEAIYYPRLSIGQIWVDANTLAYYWRDTGNDFEIKKITLKGMTVRVDERKNLIIEKK